MPKSLKYVGLLFKHFWAAFLDHKWKALIVVVVLTIICSITMQYDRAWLEVIRQGKEGNPTINRIGEHVSVYTRFQFTPLALCFVIWMVGWIAKRPALKRAALICFVAGTFTGIFVNFLRPTFGRPRPRAEMVDQFMWFEVTSNHLSFPSGHTMSNVGGGTALMLTQPIVGVPYFLLSLGSGWSRMELNAHYPTDVFAGIVLGGGFGILFVVAGRRIKEPDDPLELE